MHEPRYRPWGTVTPEYWATGDGIPDYQEVAMPPALDARYQNLPPAAAYVYRRLGGQRQPLLPLIQMR
ncbi:hypothetical protein [Streptomyces sp. NPDC002845]